MKLRQTFMLGATVALLAFLGTLQVHAQGARQRPFSDWLDAQYFNPAVCAGYNLGWLAPPDYNPFAFIDYTGKVGACVQNHGGPAINTTVKGTVSERALPDGTAEILVTVYFTNALAWSMNWPGGPMIFGYRQSELFGHSELTPGLGSGNLQAKFIIPYPGAPLEDLLVYNWSFISFRAIASGPLRAAFGVPEGTPGKFVVSQTGLFNVSGGGAGVADGFPAEIVRVFQAGN